MGSTTISLRDEAYERLKALKSGDKSFSDVVLELAENRSGNFENIVGMETDLTVEELLKHREEEEFGDER